MPRERHRPEESKSEMPKERRRTLVWVDPANAFVMVEYVQCWLGSVLYSSSFSILGGLFACVVLALVSELGPESTKIPSFALPILTSAVIGAALIRLSGVLTNYEAILPHEKTKRTVILVAPAPETAKKEVVNYSFKEGFSLLLPSLTKDMIFFPIAAYLLVEVGAGSIQKDSWKLDLKAILYVLMMSFAGMRQIDCMCNFFRTRGSWKNGTTSSTETSSVVRAKLALLWAFMARTKAALSQGRGEFFLHIGIAGYIVMMKYVLLVYGHSQRVIVSFSVFSLALRFTSKRALSYLFLPGGPLDGVVDYAFVRKSVTTTSIVLQTLIRVSLGLFCSPSTILITILGFVFGEILSRGISASKLYHELNTWREAHKDDNEQQKQECEKRIDVHLEKVEADMKGEHVAIFTAFFLRMFFSKYSNFALQQELTIKVGVQLFMVTIIQFAVELISDILSMVVESLALSDYLRSHVQHAKSKREGAPEFPSNCISFYVGAINVFFCFVVLIGYYDRSGCDSSV